MAGWAQRPAKVSPAGLAVLLGLLVIGVPLLIIAARPDRSDVTGAAYNAASELRESGGGDIAYGDVWAALVRSNPGTAKSASIADELDLREAGSSGSASRFEISRDDGAHPVCLVVWGSSTFTAPEPLEEPLGARISVDEGPC
ncbi:hypothetical protein [Pseudonocardia lacus]|uniref:hypothetical protein n=1 Tax=Pseudonocardia lacus TaxID=2835865 RepID=UPI001BDCD3AF|nr:hypothetical protein [Pseudonocardia lacus]